ncbi:type II secretion system GspH family protein [Aquabacterium sp. A7-Y]|uniref:type II secretion system protein n=1 Tax=Aquabacterium sp. A7-Y TaxID=1349605 RepID=UPI00223E331C|nr:type II secretion system protein [Aquabacterium sp. A7-Y]MCW7537683.1 type II secretion system GspH family protein [Aquabacterium sp. A7-Y]
MRRRLTLCRTASRGARGFSLVEMLVVLAIMAVLASIGFPLAEIVAKREKEEELRAALREIRSALDVHKRLADEGRVQRQADGSGYPANLSALVLGVEDLRSPTRQKIYLLRRLPADPFATPAEIGGASGSADPMQVAAASWGLRSYASEPNDPKPGLDVFDVYSKSPDVGLNGVPYREW